MNYQEKLNMLNKTKEEDKKNITSKPEIKNSIKKDKQCSIKIIIQKKKK